MNPSIEKADKVLLYALSGNEVFLVYGSRYFFALFLLINTMHIDLPDLSLSGPPNE